VRKTQAKILFLYSDTLLEMNDKILQDILGTIILYTMNAFTAILLGSY